MSFVPPLFANFGTKCKDLFTKQFDFKNELKTKNTVQPDLTVESGVVLGEASELSGNAKCTYKPKFGSLEVEGDTKGTATGTLKLMDLYKDLTLIFKGTEKPSGKLTAEYKTKAVAVSVAADANKSSTKTEGTIAVGFDGLALGLQGVYNINKVAVDDYNAGVEYSAGKDYTATLKTTDKAEKMVAQFIYFKNAATQIGTQANFDVQSGKRVFGIATQHDLDGKTLVKAKVDTDGIVAAVLEHKLANPQLKLQFSSQHNLKKSGAAESFGVGFVFGDF